MESPKGDRKLAEVFLDFNIKHIHRLVNVMLDRGAAASLTFHEEFVDRYRNSRDLTGAYAAAEQKIANFQRDGSYHYKKEKKSGPNAAAGDGAGTKPVQTATGAVAAWKASNPKNATPSGTG